MNNPDFGKTMEYLTKNKDIKLIKTEAWRKYLVSEPSYHSIVLIWFRETKL